jgi:hypothetical protein
LISLIEYSILARTFDLVAVVRALDRVDDAAMKIAVVDEIPPPAADYGAMAAIALMT